MTKVTYIEADGTQHVVDAAEGISEGARDSSRLACQIKLTAELDGLVLRMPEAQFQARPQGRRGETRS